MSVVGVVVLVPVVAVVVVEMVVEVSVVVIADWPYEKVKACPQPSEGMDRDLFHAVASEHCKSEE